ncbi:MAG: hypothetical protein K2H85_06600 [Allobaculum sp.]|nr:hypothetical protein [Allobaculum sp.]
MAKKKKKKKQVTNTAYQFGQALGALLVLGALGSVIKEVFTEEEKPSSSEETEDLKA